MHVCPTRRPSYGFNHVAISSNASPSLRSMWKTAFSAEDIPIVIYVYPESPAERAGLRVNDLIISVNGVPWPELASDQLKYVEALSTAKQTQSNMNLSIRRDGKDMAITLASELTCDININLIANQRTSAFAGNRTISIESGANRLLSEDGEMAFVISHEIAHVALGHSPEQSGSISREQMELDADEMGMALMLRAGYPRESAASAIRKLDAANRGPLSRLFGIYGPYKTTEQRVQFLNLAAERALNKK